MGWRWPKVRAFLQHRRAQALGYLKRRIRPRGRWARKWMATTLLLLLPLRGAHGTSACLPKSSKECKKVGNFSTLTTQYSQPPLFKWQGAYFHLGILHHRVPGCVSLLKMGFQNKQAQRRALVVSSPDLCKLELK